MTRLDFDGNGSMRRDVSAHTDARLSMRTLLARMSRFCSAHPRRGAGDIVHSKSQETPSNSPVHGTYAGAYAMTSSNSDGAITVIAAIAGRMSPKRRYVRVW
jgi:hypothetical protein